MRISIYPRKVCEEHIRGCDLAGIEILVTSTYRDVESQAALYEIGRTKELHRKPVTNARAGQSWHNFRCAWDVVPIIGGKAAWDSDLWTEIIKIGKAAGAEAGGEWKTFPDRPHFQVKPDKTFTLVQAMDRFRENGTIFI